MLQRRNDVGSLLRDHAQLRVINRSRGVVLAECAEVAANSWRRMRGLLGRPELTPGQGLLIVPCQGVHTVGMGYPIDVVHLDRDGVVRKVLHGVRPWRIGPLIWRSRFVLELPAGGAAGTVAGDRLTLSPLQPTRSLTEEACVFVSPVADAETTNQSSGGTSLIRLLFDRTLPALLFGLIALLQFAGVVIGILHPPTEANLTIWLSHLLDLSHKLLAFLFVALVTVLFLIRRAPKGRRAGPLPMALALLGTFSMYLAVGQPVTIVGWEVLAVADLLMVAGLAFTVYAAASLRSCFGLAAEARGLVTGGAYRWVRHPIYLGEFIVFVGMVLPLLAPSTVAIFALFCLLQAARATLEERVLASTFAEYVAYRRRTPALLPWPRP